MITEVVPDPGEVPVLDWIETGRISVDPLYQRPLDDARVASILKGFTWRSFGALVVVPAGDGYHVTDGQHRLEAAKAHPKVSHVPAVIVKSPDIATEATIFVDINKHRKNVSPLELFFAELAAGTGCATEVMKAAQRAGIRIPKSPGHFKPNDSIAVGEMQKLMSGYVEARVDEFLWTAAAGGFKPIMANHLKAVEHLLTDSEFAPYITAEDLANTIRKVGTSLDKEAKRFAATHGITFWKGLASVWFQKVKKRQTPAPVEAKPARAEAGSSAGAFGVAVSTRPASRLRTFVPHVIANQKNVTAAVCGDPAPGRSALDHKARQAQ